MLGVNISGGEYKESGTRYGYDYIYPSNTEIDYYASKGMDVIRVPFQWERLQPTVNGSLNSAEVSRLKAVVAHANSKGMAVVLDSHDYGTRNINGTAYKVGMDAQAPGSILANFWGKMAAQFKGSNVLYNIMNEPHYQTASQWVKIANATIKAIRDAGATQKILVPGSYWTGAHSWVSTDNDTAVGLGTVDPLKNYAFDVHQYLDANSSGTSPTAVSADIGVQRLKTITEWARAHDKELFLGEFGAANNSTALAALDKMVKYMDDNADVWAGATYWAGGPWWGNYMYSIEPTDLKTKGVNATDKPQMNILEKYDLKDTGAAPAPAPAPAPTPSQPATIRGTTGNDKLIGTSHGDVMDGLAGNDILDGKAGADVMRGGSGNDIYYVDNGKEKVVESAKQGVDTVRSYVNHALAANVENIELLGTATLGAAGNGLANQLKGNSAGNTLSGAGGNDSLWGGLGNDRLEGGLGKDAFVFNFKLSSKSNVDTIKDFSVADDTIVLENAIFKALPKTGTLDSGSFYKGVKAHDSSDHIIYDSATGALSYDADGTGAAAGVKFAQLNKGLALTSHDFLVI